MTHTTEHEYHADRPIVHFGNPGVPYWKERKQVIYKDVDNGKRSRRN